MSGRPGSGSAKTDPDNVEAYVGLGFLHRRQQRWDEAFEAFEHALRADGEQEQAYYQIGRTGAPSGENLPRAIEATRHYLDHYATEPRFHAAAHWRLGVLYEHQGNADLARDPYRRAVEIDPRHDHARKALKKLESRCPGLLDISSNTYYHTGSAVEEATEWPAGHRKRLGKALSFPRCGSWRCATRRSSGSTRGCTGSGV